MKKTLSVFLILTLLFALTACQEAPVVLTTTTVPNITPTTPTPTGPLYDRTSYTATAEEIAVLFDTVVVQVGDLTADMELLQIAYWSAFLEFMGVHASNLTPFELDPGLALASQTNPGNGGTWQQYFLKKGLERLHEYLSMAYAAQAEGITLPEYLLTLLENDMNDLKDAAEADGYTDLDAYVEYLYGPGCTVNALEEYNYLSCLSDYYFDILCSRLDITDQMIQDYYNKNEKELNDANIVKDGSIVYKVRHILIAIEEDADDAAWEECRVTAQGLLDTYLAGQQSEDAFSTLAVENSHDGTTALNGGLINGLVPNSTYDETFVQWYLDEDRQYGDCELLKTDLGYQVVYYVGTEETWHYECGQAVANIMVDQLIPDVMAQYSMTVQYSKLWVCEAFTDTKVEE